MLPFGGLGAFWSNLLLARPDWLALESWRSVELSLGVHGAINGLRQAADSMWGRDSSPAKFRDCCHQGAITRSLTCTPINHSGFDKRSAGLSVLISRDCLSTPQDAAETQVSRAEAPEEVG
jgi:hypothetical protein